MALTAFQKGDVVRLKDGSRILLLTDAFDYAPWDRWCASIPIPILKKMMG